MNNKISLRNWIICLILAGLGIVAMRFNGKPVIYIGLIFAFLAIVLIGLFSNLRVGAVSGIVIPLAGYFLRKYYPVVSKLKGAKLEAFLKKEQAYNNFLDSYLWMILLFGLILGLLCGHIGESLKEEKKKKFSTNKITYMAVFIALSVVINTVRVGSISFGGFPIIMSGYLLGPLSGFIVGGLADLLGFLVRPSGLQFNIIFSLTSALTGLIPVLVTRALGQRHPKYSFVMVLIGTIVGQVVTSVLMVPFFSQLLYGRVFAVDAIKALTKQAFSVPIYAFLIVTINDRLSKVIEFDRI